MSKENEMAFEVFIEEFWKNKKEFTLKEVEDELLKKAKTIRIAPGRTIKDWIDSMVEFGELEEIRTYVYKKALRADERKKRKEVSGE